MSPAALDFGEVVETSEFRHELPLRNTTSGSLTVRLEPSCDCAGVEPETLRLGPGEAGRAVVRLDLLHNRGHHFGLSVRPYQAHVTAMWGDHPRDRLALRLIGSVRAILDIWPPNLHLAEELIEGEDGAEEVVEIKPVVALQWLAIKECPPYFSARIEKSKTGYTLHVRPKAGLPRGFFNKSVVLELADAKGAALPDQVLPVTGAVTGRFVCTAAQTIFGLRTVGTETEETVRVHGRKGEPFTVVKATAEGVGTCVDRASGSASESLYRVRQRITKAGSRKATVAFVVRDERGKEHALEYALTYYGTELR